MKNIVMELVLGLALCGLSSAAAFASAKTPMLPEDPVPVCGQQGAPCGGDVDCCGGFSCKQHMETGKRSCQPD